MALVGLLSSPLHGWCLVFLTRIASVFVILEKAEALSRALEEVTESVGEYPKPQTLNPPKP